MSEASWVVPFDEGGREMRELLGGKGANVAEMTRVLGAGRVPTGFTITTAACVRYMRDDRAFPDGLEEEVAAALAALEERAGKRLGDAQDPLLVSVRSGARESMPGMMDTVLNLGLNDDSVLGLAARTENPRFAWDAYRRFVQMFANVCRGIPGEALEAAIARRKAAAGVTDDVELDEDELRGLVGDFTAIFTEQTGEPFPQDPADQLRQAIRAVFDSWVGKRAQTYRRINHIPDDWGTACNVQQMVFGNKGDTSCSGVAFSRDEVTGAPEPSGDFLVNAQGEDVVSGVRTPRDLSEMAAVMPDAHAELLRILRTLEAHYGDMQDTEFTVEEGQLYMLQTRNAKRPAQAAVRFAVDAVAEGLLDERAALTTIDAASLDALLHPTFDPAAAFNVLATGVAASPGAAKGQIVFTPDDAVDWAQRGRAVVLVRPFTEADDVHGFFAAQGILTAEGGKASRTPRWSRAGWASRASPAPPRCGSTSRQRTLRVGETSLHEGDLIAIDGSTGRVSADDVAALRARGRPEPRRRSSTWADRHRRLGVRANADTPEDARKAREFGAEGIGLCRTEHMFMAADRQPKMQAMIMAEDGEHRRAALAELLPLQTEDFEGLFEAMAGLPVTIRLLDPPLHEFLPNGEDLAVELERARHERPGDVRRLERTLDRVRQLEETNPMLGTRGARLGIIAPEIYDVQVEAIIAAARAVRERTGDTPQVEIMLPLVAYEQEVAILRARVEHVIAEHGRRGPAPADRDDDRAAARVLHRRPDRAARPTSSPSAPTTSPRPRSASRATTSSPASSPTTSSSGSSTAPRSRRSTGPASAGSSGSARGSGARPSRRSSSASAASTAATPTRSPSSTWPAWTTSPARPYRVPIARLAAAQAAIAR